MGRTNATLAGVGQQIRELYKELGHSVAVEDPAWARLDNEMQRYELWARNLGLYTAGHSSLDYRFRDAQLLFDHTLDLLGDLTRVLSQLLKVVTKDMSRGEDISEDSEEEDISSYQDKPLFEVFTISTGATIDKLYRLAFKIRNPAMRLGSSKALGYREVDRETGVDLMKQFAQLDERYIQDLFHSYNASHTDDHYLIPRLAKANTRRRQQFRYWKKRRDALERLSTADAVDEDGDKRPEQAMGERQNLLVPGMEPIVMAPSQPSTATWLDVEKVRLEDDMSVISTVSFLYANNDEDKDSVSLPAPPKLGPEMKEFECPYCFTICPRKLVNKKNWEAHILRDLRPYICTFDHCKTPDQPYDSISDWINHEALNHGMKDPNGNSHQIAPTGHDTSRNCPFCLVSAASPFHVASHLHRIASFALPRSNSDDDAGDGSNLSDQAGLRSQESQLSGVMFSDESGHENDLSSNDPEHVSSFSLEDLKQISPVNDAELSNVYSFLDALDEKSRPRSRSDGARPVRPEGKSSQYDSDSAHEARDSPAAAPRLIGDATATPGLPIGGLDGTGLLASQEEAADKPAAVTPDLTTIADKDTVDEPQGDATGGVGGAVPTTIEWTAGGNEVYVTGSFVNWEEKVRLHKSDNNPDILSTKLSLRPGIHHLKFIVDGEMRVSPNLPAAVDHTNVVVNYIESSVDNVSQSRRDGGKAVEPGVYPAQVLPEEVYEGEVEAAVDGERSATYGAMADALALRDALSSQRINTKTLIRILPHLTNTEILDLREEYKNHVKIHGKGVNLAKHIRLKLGNSALGKVCYATALGRWESEAFWANCYYQSGSSSHELLIETLFGRGNGEMREIKASFKDSRYADSLEKCIKAELRDDKFRTAVLLALEESRQSERDSVDPELVHRDVQDLRSALVSRNGGETAMIHIIVRRSDSHLREVLRAYKKNFQQDFAREMLQKLQNLIGETLAHILNGAINRPMRDALLLHQALRASRSGAERPELLISRLVRLHWEPHYLENVKNQFCRNGKRLEEAIAEEILPSSGGSDWGEFCIQLAQSSKRFAGTD
ncbi:hypothetical protein BDW71DRAFT_212290 [Aspergillus fruticulosus]